jgi:hypothetical protein
VGDLYYRMKQTNLSLWATNLSPKKVTFSKYFRKDSSNNFALVDCQNHFKKPKQEDEKKKEELLEVITEEDSSPAPVKKKRKLIESIHEGLSKQIYEEDEPIYNEDDISLYEKERIENIRNNKKMMVSQSSSNFPTYCNTRKVLEFMNLRRM